MICQLALYDASDDYVNNINSKIDDLAGALMGIPFTGGSSAVIAVGCIGAIASGISAGISAYNTYWTYKENKKALSIEGDPAMARFHGDVSKYSDYVEKTDFGSAEANQKAAKTAQTLNTTQAVADVVSVGCTMATTFGTKSVQVVDKTGAVKDMYWSSFLVTLCSEIMLYIETPLVSYSYSLNEVSHSCIS